MTAILMVALFRGARTVAEAVFPGVNGKILFNRFEDGNYLIYSMNVDGSGQTRLTAGENPAWSPTGQKIAFDSHRSGEFRIYSMNVDGSGQTRLTYGARGIHATWSPTSQKIAFTSFRDGNSEIYVINADGSGQTNLTNHPANDSVPQWSPDGRRLAFTSERDGNAEIYAMNADGTAVTRLTAHPALDGSPAWSPDGQKVAFASLRHENAGPICVSCVEIYTMNADGTGVARLTTNSANDVRPDWQPLVTPGTLRDLIAQFASDPKAAEQLVQKLDTILNVPAGTARANQLENFEKQVNGEIGKTLTADEAAILIRLARAL